MDVNYNIYGAPETWVDAIFNFPQVVNKHKVANFGNGGTSLRAAIDNGKLQNAEPLDKSLSYCGLGESSFFNTIRYVRYNPDTKNAELYSEDSRTVTNFAFTGRDSDNFSEAYITTVGENDSFNYMECSWSPNEYKYSDHGRNWTYLNTVATSINPKEFILEIVVYVCKNPKVREMEILDCDLYTWENNINGARDNYPYLMRAGTLTFMSSIAGERERIRNRFNSISKGNLSISILDKLNIPLYSSSGKKDVEYYNYTMFCPRRGDNIVLWGSFTETLEWSGFEKDIMPVLGNGELLGFETDSGSRPKGMVRTFAPYSPELCESIRKACACYGLFFTDKASVAANGSLNDPDMYLGILENGIGNGKYSRGIDNEKQPQWTWKDTTESEYDYTKNVDDNIYDRNTKFNNTVYSDSITSRYVINGIATRELKNALFSAMKLKQPGDFANDFSLNTFLVSEPINSIISLKRFPVDLQEIAGNTTNIYFGSYKSDITGLPLNTLCKIYDLGQCTYFKHNDNFLDYEPYSIAHLCIPFCGSVQIKPSIYMGHIIRVKMAIDFSTGECTAYILCDDLCLQTISGKCSIDIPVTGVNANQVDTQIFNANQALKSAQLQADRANMNYGSSAIKTLVSAATGNAWGLVDGITGLANVENLEIADLAVEARDFALKHIEAPFESIGGQSGGTSWTAETFCRLILHRPVMSDGYNPEIYGKTVGFATLKNDKLSNYNGFTVVSGARLDNISCTKKEKRMIETVLNSGVIL